MRLSAQPKTEIIYFAHIEYLDNNTETVKGITDFKVSDGMLIFEIGHDIYFIPASRIKNMIMSPVEKE